MIHALLHLQHSNEMSGTIYFEDIKLSNLDYALLPTTKLSINSLDVQTSLELSITSSPTYPYISTLNVTMERLPKYKFKVTPLSESRYVFASQY